jgi:NAD(P)-dependent dehydrogenase (short-subunit alcohol dehydrogenase family)
MVQLSLADQTVLVTGGGSGIGKGVAAAVVAAGGNAMLVGRNADRLAGAADEIKAAGGAGSVLYEPADVINEEEVAHVVEAATAWTGRLHGVVHCAGGSETIGPITQVDSDAWRRTVDLNVNGTMYVLKRSAGTGPRRRRVVHRHLVDRGEQHPPLVRRVRRVKSAVDHLMQLAADELEPSWVRSECIRPGLIRTDLVEAVFQSPEISGDYASSTPLPRPGEVEDIANAAVFLLSDASSYITGQVINVDGGQMLRRGPDFSAMLEPVFGADGLRGVVSN